MYIIDGKRYQEDPAHKLGGGSEGQVFAFPGDPNQCVKLFHEPDKGDRDGQHLADYRGRKVAGICRIMPTFGLPDQFIVPIRPAFDARSHISGFLMRRIPSGFEKISRLVEVQFRVTHDIDLRKITELYVYIFDDIGLLHGKGLTIGDVNMGLLMFRPDTVSSRVFVDTDSWSYPNLPCIATTELFCHPDLYANLTRGNPLVVPQPQHDRFAVLVMFMLTALGGAHPFRMGIHAKYRSLRERCEHGVTILDPDVTYPPFLAPREILSDDVLHELVRRLKRQTADPLPPDLLNKFRQDVIDCPNCQAQYHRSRKECPKCHERTLMQVAARAVEELLGTVGVILFAQVVGTSLHVACRIRGMLRLIIIDERKQARSIVTQLPASPGARYRFFDSYLVVCNDPNGEAPVNLKIYKIESASIRHVHQTSSNGLENGPVVFETTGRYLYRTAGNTLMRLEFFNGFPMEREVTQVYRTQTWFTADRTSGGDSEVLFGYHRALAKQEWFVIADSARGTAVRCHTLSLPMRVREKLDDFAVYFNSASVLLVRKTVYQGQDYVRYCVISHDGTVTRDATLGERDPGFEFWSQIHGKLYQALSVLHLSSQGIVKHNFLDDSYSTVGNTNIVTLDDRLLRFAKTLAVIRRTSVLAITPTK